MPVFVALVAAVTALLASRRRRRRSDRLPAVAEIISPPKATVIARDGAVSSVQSAELTLAYDDWKRMWNATHLENLARTYWLFLSRVTGWTIRVVYGENERSVVLFGRLLTLLRFDAPEYVLQRERGMVRWRIRDGLLVAREGRGCGFLSLDVSYLGTHPHRRIKHRIDVEVANIYTAIAVTFSTPV